MKNILFICVFISCILTGCAASTQTKTYSNSLYKSDQDRHVINNLITLKHDFDVEYVGTLTFTLDDECTHSKAVQYARNMNFADELGSITMLQEILESKQVITEIYSDGHESKSTLKLPTKYKCSYSALGFKIINKSDNERK